MFIREYFGDLFFALRWFPKDGKTIVEPALFSETVEMLDDLLVVAAPRNEVMLRAGLYSDSLES